MDRLRLRMEEQTPSPRSPEAKLGLKLEDLWDIQEPQLTPSEKLNSCFDSIPVSSFPPASSSQVIEINSNSSLAEAVQILSEHKILSAPVRNVDAPEDASWIDRYMGIVEFAGIAVWLLHQSELAALRMMSGSTAIGLVTGGVGAAVSAATLGTPTSAIVGTSLVAGAGAGVTTAVGPGHSGPEAAASMGGTFFETLTSSDFYKKTKVEDISGSFRWAPFLALQKSDTFLTMLLLLSKYKMKSLPVVDLGGGKIENVITQSAVVHMLAECVGLHWFENWGTKRLSELGLPFMKHDKLIKVFEDEPVLQAFKLIREKRIGGIPVVDSSGRKAIGNISIRDVQFLLTAPEIYKNDRVNRESLRFHVPACRSITAKDFLTAVRCYLEKHQEESPMLLGTVTCGRDSTIKEVIQKLDSEKIHRIYVVDSDDNLEGVITLRDIISKLVHEPRGYFGDFFDGVVPMPRNSRV